MKQPYLRFLFTVLGVAFLALSALAQQSATATLEGIVTDANNAVVPNAKVVIRSVDTGFTREVATDANGIYRLPALPPGNYQLIASAAGFAEGKFNGITLTVGQKLNLDLTLKVSGVGETVEITDIAPVIETTRSSVSGSVNSKAVSELPVNGRNFLDFATLTPGVVRDSTRQGDLSFGGQRGTFNSIQIDGVDNNNNFFGQALGRTGSGRAPYQFSQDAVQEFQVNTNSFSAEFGRAAGGTINVVTKSGTNDFHGVAYEYFGNDALNANNPFLKAVGARQPVLKRNIFGATLGGPIQKDKAFFFVSYQGTRERNGASRLNSLSVNVLVDPLLTNDRSAATLGAAYRLPAINPVALALLNA